MLLQRFVAAGDIFDAEMDSSESDDDDYAVGDDGDRRKQERKDSVPENKGNFCTLKQWKGHNGSVRIFITVKCLLRAT